MANIKFTCYTCRKIIEQDELEYLSQPDPHEGHNRKWDQSPTIETPGEITSKVTVSDAITFESDVKLLRNVMASLNNVVFERQDVIRALVLAILARQHAIIYGPPGTAKNWLVEKLAESVERSYFEYQISQNTVLDELYGPFDLIHMRENGEMRRQIEGTMLEAEVAFLDEIGNSSSPIRNALKWIMNERKYRYGRKVNMAPLQTIVAASNAVLQWEEDATEAAFSDRFLIRESVDYLQEAESEFKMLKLRGSKTSLPVIGHDVLTRLQKYTTEVEFSDEFLKGAVDFRHKILEDSDAGNLRVSDRRFMHTMDLCAANAVLNGRTKVKRADLVVFGLTFWNDPETQKRPLHDWLKHHLVSNLDKIEAIMSTLDQIYAAFESSQSEDSVHDAAGKMALAVQSQAMIKQQMSNMNRLRTQVEDEEERDAVNGFDSKVKDYMAKILDATLVFEDDDIDNDNLDFDSLKKE